ncbi:MAG: bifunctional 5,10-methylenetetrahydrofolate dehydrogenase/5,10-methenyltetrahydrofolate cyclohydrolase [Candidatus Omnitrophota bacterium]
MAKILEAKIIYDRLKLELRRNIAQLPRLTLASLSMADNYSCEVYLNSQRKLAEDVGVDYLAIELPKNVSSQKVIDTIKDLNRKDKITGIMVNKPFPEGLDEAEVFAAIQTQKDIEGVNPYNLGRLFIGEPLFISPTVLSVLELLKTTKVNLYGKEVVIVGFSTLIGKPLALLLGKEFATVSVTHIATYERGRLAAYIKSADIVISAVGKPHLIKGEWIKKRAIVIDVGIGEKDGKLVGDVEFAAARAKASFITPVPGGVGKLTTMFLFKNLLVAYQLNHDH